MNFKNIKQKVKLFSKEKGLNFRFNYEQRNDYVYYDDFVVDIYWIQDGISYNIAVYQDYIDDKKNSWTLCCVAHSTKEDKRFHTTKTYVSGKSIEFISQRLTPLLNESYNYITSLSPKELITGNTKAEDSYNQSTYIKSYPPWGIYMIREFIWLILIGVPYFAISKVDSKYIFNYWLMAVVLLLLIILKHAQFFRRICEFHFYEKKITIKYIFRLPRKYEIDIKNIEEVSFFANTTSYDWGSSFYFIFKNGKRKLGYIVHDKLENFSQLLRLNKIKTTTTNYSPY
ncbi:MAG: hypothetical protein J0M08_06975 [Bacteroidetes bacterium]|nr:hypothetical protein [Bacteroidota bacterium]